MHQQEPVTVTIDAREMTSRGAAHAVLARALSLPDYYGRNLDALHDCLTEIGVPTQIVIMHAGALEETLGGYGALILRVLIEAAEENPAITLLMDGEDWL